LPTSAQTLVKPRAFTTEEDNNKAKIGFTQFCWLLD